MAYTNYELEREAFAERPHLKKLVQDLLCHAADAHKNMNRMFGRKKYVEHLHETTRLLNTLSVYAGSLDKTEEMIEVIKEIYPNWQDAYTIIDAIIKNSRQS